jgi:RNA-directed DNA polymerase
MLQVWVPHGAPAFSERRDGVRPGRSAHHALEQACRDMADGDRWGVHLALAPCFDSVPHALVMSRVARQGKDKRLWRWSRRYLNAGRMHEGVVSQREAGMPRALRGPRS